MVGGLGAQHYLFMSLLSESKLKLLFVQNVLIFVCNDFLSPIFRTWIVITADKLACLLQSKFVIQALLIKSTLTIFFFFVLSWLHFN